MCANDSGGLGIDSPHLHPQDRLRRKPRRQAVVESTVAIEKRGVRPVERDAAFVHDEHRNLRAILRGVEDLLRLERGAVDRNVRL